MGRSTRGTEWATEERPRERLYHKGAAALSDAELLAIQLGTGVPGLSVLEVARELLTQFGSLQELAGGGVGEGAGVLRVGAGQGVPVGAGLRMTTSVLWAGNSSLPPSSD